MSAPSPFMLPQRPSLLALESGAEYLPRLAWKNGFASAMEFGAITGFKPDSLIKMHDADAAWLWELTGIPKAEFKRFAMPANAIIRFGSGLVKRTQLQTTGVRYCPTCLRTDAANGIPHIRGPWKWRMIARCPVHGCVLEFDRLGVAHLENFESLAHEPCEQPTASSISSDSYFLARLVADNTAAQDNFLDGMPAYVAAEFCTVVGHLEAGLLGRPLKERIPDGFENPELRQLGFEIATHGRDAVWRFLETIVETTSKRVKHPLDMFRSVLYWASINKHNSDYNGVFRFLQEVAEENMPLAPGDAFIWRIKKRKVFTLATASVEYQLSEKRVLRVLATRYKDRELPRFLKRNDVHALLLEAASYVTTSEAAQAIGCSMELCDALIKRGHVAVFSNSEESTRVYRLVHKVEIEALLRQLDSCIDRSLSTAGMVSTSEVLRMRAYRAIDLFEYMLEKAIVRIASDSDVPRFNNLYFDLGEIRSVFKSRSTSPFDELLDVRAAGRRLGVKKSAVDQLIADNIFQSHIVTVSGRDVIKLSSADIEAFVNDHVSVSELARKMSADASEITRNLNGVGITPVVNSHYNLDHFYRRDELPETLIS
ncbi:TniQ family protein [Rhizobium sp. 2YAF20]|uniref:TniQ family protein n=1 Tax=Rhizobium sp. 2YAF20 TaxID=3233027 RepID=UPI003F9D7F36